MHHAHTPATPQDAHTHVKPIAVRDRERIIQRIVTMNPGAGVEFLARFSVEQLAAYEEHLQLHNAPRNPRVARPWVRQEGVPAIAAYKRPA